MINDLLSATSRLFFWIIALALLFIVLMFAMQNNHDVSIYFDFFKSNSMHMPIITLPVWGGAFIIFGLGAIVGALFVWYRLSYLEDEMQQEKQCNQKLKSDMEKLKNTISKTVS